MSWPFDAADGADSWDAAERVAAEQRARRSGSSTRRSVLVRRLGAVVVVVWAGCVVLTITTFLSPPAGRDALRLITDGSVLALFLLGGWWLTASRRYLLRGSPNSIRNALPPGAWHSVRRQLAGRAPFDRERTDVLVELAHQQRSVLRGSSALIALYVPLYLSMATTSHDWLGLIFLSVGAVVLGVGAACIGVARRRLTRFIRRTEDALATAE